jgi:hypothetical protein
MKEDKRRLSSFIPHPSSFSSVVGGCAPATIPPSWLAACELLDLDVRVDGVPWPRQGPGGGFMAKKTTCPITRADFRSKAKPVKVVINGVEQEAEVKEFSTGSLGWYLNAKIGLDVEGVRVPVQIGLNLTIVGSKELPQDTPANPATSSAASATDKA